MLTISNKMDERKYNMISKYLDYHFGEIIRTEKRYDDDKYYSLYVYTSNYGDDDASYIITSEGVLFLNDDIRKFVTQMFDLTYQELIKVLSRKLNTKIHTVL